MWVIERQALPYLAIIGLFALLTLPAPWRGLRSVNGWLLLLTYLAYLAQALLRGREKGEDLAWHRRERWMAAAGIGALAVGAYFTVFSTERIVSALAISKVVGGLFITDLWPLPEVFVALMPALYAAFIHFGGREHGFRCWQVLIFPAAYLTFVAIVAFWVLPGSSSGHGTAGI